MSPTLGPPNAANDKEAWRAAARIARDTVDTAAWSRGIVAAVRAWPAYQQADTVALYLPFGSEADLQALLADGKRFAAPRTAARGRRMRMHLLGGPRQRHRFGMDEPAADAPSLLGDEIDLVLVPGLAFDPTGGRLGYGGGYYDGWLAGLRPDTPRLGVAHPDLLAEALPLEPHDVRMTHLALPDGVRRVTAGPGF